MADTTGTSPSTRRVAAPRARDTPPFDGVLFVDMENLRAKYECLRPNCPHRLEGPIHSCDPVPGQTKRWVGAAGVKAFIDNVKKRHLAQHHGEQR
ncbi:hypothetical protein DMA15_17475 [Streptomyces sp. WAC 01529]|uniref:hypothetical protein n=1 Tax=Streptomyces sp. WAC 01529 TaxID=2203205 RepID=UPI000F712E57|nr:hypothetical protein [Streptomyces sp. WAC 01529]AZM54139.1 hypothetical protein DMA15_17475 [Streptomyces sp. WAC 01529]